MAEPDRDDAGPRSGPGRYARWCTFLIALALQSRIRRQRGGRQAPPGPALIAIAGLPRTLSEGRLAVAVAALGSLALLRLPARIAPRRGVAGVVLRAGVLALTFDAWSASRRGEAVADALARDDLAAAREELVALSDEALPFEMTAQEIADRAEEVLASGVADGSVGPWLAYALFDLPGAVGYHLPAVLVRLWGDVPGAVFRVPGLNRALGVGAGPALLRGLAGRAAGLAYGCAAPVVGGNPVSAVRASIRADVPALAAAQAVTVPASDPASGLRSALRLHRAALVVAAVAASLLVLMERGPGRWRG